MEKSPRVRFAPSPTGYLHVGGLRTALYNYLFAKKNNGTFILRIEDTDQSRFVPGAVESLAKTLHVMGIDPDEGVILDADVITESGEKGPYIQSKRLSLYKKYADKLLADGKAYECFCTAERLEQLRKDQSLQKLAPRYDKHCLTLSAAERNDRVEKGEAHVLRLNVQVDRGVIEFEDMIRGKVSIHTKDIDDQVLIKSDGFPTGVFAIAVDDILMEITHVIKGEEWLSTTPKQILVYEALERTIPKFTHLPLLLNPDKSKLSKRQGDVAVEDFLKKGYLKETLINFSALLGWNPGKGNTQEIFSLEELVKVFDFPQVHKSGAVFDMKKLDWMNGEYIKKLSVDDLYVLVSQGGFLEKELIRRAAPEKQSEQYLKKVLTVEQERLVRLSDIGEANTFLFQEELSYDASMLHWKENTPLMTKVALEKAMQLFEELEEVTFENKEALGTSLMEAAGEKKGDFLWPLRVALTGAERSPSPMEVAWVLGKNECLKRLEMALQKLS